MLFQQGRAQGEDGGEGKEQSADPGSESMTDGAGDDGGRSAQRKERGEFMPLQFLQLLKIDVNAQDLPPNQHARSQGDHEPETDPGRSRDGGGDPANRQEI